MNDGDLVSVANGYCFQIDDLFSKFEDNQTSDESMAAENEGSDVNKFKLRKILLLSSNECLYVYYMLITSINTINITASTLFIHFSFMRKMG